MYDLLHVSYGAAAVHHINAVTFLELLLPKTLDGCQERVLRRHQAVRTNVDNPHAAHVVGSLSVEPERQTQLPRLATSLQDILKDERTLLHCIDEWQRRAGRANKASAEIATEDTILHEATQEWTTRTSCVSGQMRNSTNNGKESDQDKADHQTTERRASVARIIQNRDKIGQIIRPTERRASVAS